MYFWNQENFEGLASIAKGLKSEEHFALFAEYCRLKELGLKKQAVAAIKDYVSYLSELDLQTQQNICVRLTELAFWNSDIHQLLSHPIQVYITDILTNWCSQGEPEAPYTWLGYMSGDDLHFLRSLQFNPNDQVALYRLARSAVDSVDFQLHHVSESIFLGEEKDAINSLAQAKDFFGRMEDSKFKDYLTQEISDSEALLNDWLSYQQQVKSADITSMTFPKWCDLNNKGCAFSQPFYYDK